MLLSWNSLGSTRELSPEQRVYVRAALDYAKRPEFQKGIDPDILATAQDYLDKGQFVTGEIENVAQYERSGLGKEWITLNPANAGLDRIFSTGGQVSKVLADFQANKIDEKAFDSQLQTADRMGEVALANLASAIMHEATHAHLARTGREGSRLADETSAYTIEALFLSNVHKHASKAVKPGIESLINNAFSDAWSEEGVRIDESFRPR